ncbi:MAG: hypothetical protein M1820_004997 [Bogoriella megaspora]|nr:MAG: hypothetical protein M1820_004997 [Bogoriella megaspora]
MPPWGRPSGGGGRNKKAAREWERQMREWEAMQQHRFQELDSDDDDEQGVHLDPQYMQQSGDRFSSDELYFTGADLGAYRRPKNRSYEDLAYGDTPYDDSDGDGEDELHPGMALQLAMRDKEQDLVRSALARIQRAREKGKPNVNLTQEEVDALERHRAQQHQLAPAPQAKGAKGNRPGSRGNDKAKKRPSRLFANAPAPSRKPQNPRSRKSSGPTSQSPEEASYTTSSAPPGGAPGILVPGPGGTTTYAPLGYRTRDSPPTTSRSSPSRPGSRSASGSKQISPPHTQMPSYNSYSLSQYPASQYSSNPDLRPPSSSSRNSPTRSLPDDPNWAPRSRSTSNVNLQENHPPPPSAYTGYPQPPYPSTRRNVSTQDISYASVRRKPVSSSSLNASRPLPAHMSHSDPSAGARRGPGGVPVGVEIEVEESSEQSSEDESEDDGRGQGVQVGAQTQGGVRGGAYAGYGYAGGARGGGGVQRRMGR